MNKATYYRRAIAAICDACGYDPTHIPLLLRWWWSSWRHHPDYDAQTDDLFKVPVVGIWQHAPGLEQRVHSYIFGLPQDVLSSLSWGKRCFGDNFRGLYPIPPMDSHRQPLHLQPEQQLSGSKRCLLLPNDAQKAAAHGIAAAHHPRSLGQPAQPEGVGGSGQ